MKKERILSMNCVWGNQELNRSFSISTHFQGGSSQTKISSQLPTEETPSLPIGGSGLLVIKNTFLEELGLAIWQRTFNKKSCKMLLLRTTCSLTHCLDRCTIIAGLELSEFWVLLNCIQDPT
ncbi:uncharacterized protein J5M81_013662 isoform 1-T1 [Pluvialis apricaria]